MTSLKLSFNLKLAFGIGQAAEGLKNAAFGTFLIFYYNQVLGMSGALAGTAVGLAVIVDAFTDPLAGSLSDNWRSRFGRRHPFMYASIIPLSVSFYFLFNPLVTSEFALFIWLVIFTNATRTAMSLYHVPHIALGAEMTEDYDERSKLVGYRMFFSYVGVLFVFVAGFGFFFVPTEEFRNGQLNAEAYPPFALLLAVLIAITIFWSAWGTRSIIPFLPKVPEQPKISLAGVLVRVVKDLFVAMSSRSFRWLFSGVLIVFIMVGVNGALDLYIFTYFWELERATVLMVIISYPIGVLVGAFFAPFIFARWGKKAGLLFGAISWPFWQTLPIALRLTGYFPANSDDLLVPLLVGMKLIQGACTVQANIAFGSMVADIVDEHEYEHGKRQEGIFFAASSFSAKATSGVGNIIAGFALDIINWPRGAHIKTAADVPPETIVSLGMIYGPLVASFGFLSIWCYTHHKLTRERHEEILEVLATRRAESSG
ncbi:MAG TPA: MFS transporter [Gammaproteobacteria bacterium]|nr:MFS transporter [Gammaproteobacteria bacterium]HIL98413.1 MFS transporter [Pseudomonadales bacterium]